MIVIDAESSGPTQTQLAFLVEIESQLNRYVKIADEFLRKRVVVGIPDKLSVYAVLVPDESESIGKKFTVELADQSANEIFGVAFSGELPIEHYIDD